MVRFIINKASFLIYAFQVLYIPIWLDLLFESNEIRRTVENTLHSNMVRFIMNTVDAEAKFATNFTFQYG